MVTPLMRFSFLDRIAIASSLNVNSVGKEVAWQIEYLLLPCYHSCGLAKHQPKISQILIDLMTKINMPGWKHKRGEPMLGSKNVIEDFWSISNRVIKISVLPHKSAEEAREALRAFVKYDREREEIKGLGDESYAWGYGLSNIVFSKGRFTFYVSTTANVDRDADARSLSQRERGERERLEMT